MANTTWNPADLTNITLTGGNLIAAATASTAGVRGKDALSAGKYYWEYTFTTIQTNTITGGIALSTTSLTSPTTGSSTVARSNGNININGIGSGSTLGILAVGAVLGVAVDFTGKLIWYRVAPVGNWNGSGTANPGTATGGLSISAITIGPLYPIMAGQTLDKLTANFGDTAFSGAVPSGFTAGFPAGSAAASAQARAMVMA